jgi:hypothetical protein
MDERTTACALSLKELMDRETGLFERLGVEVDLLGECLQARSWTPALSAAQAIEGYSQRIAEADGERDQAFVLLRDALGLPRETAFSAVLPSLPGAHRRELEESWRRLRMSVVRVRAATGRMRYTGEALAEALNRILEGIFPYRKGKIYSRQGTPTSVSGAVLVDRRL